MADHEEQQRAHLFQRILLLLLGVFILLLIFEWLWGNYGAVAGLSMALVGTTTTLWLNRHGMVRLAGLFFALMLLVMVTALSTFGQGIHDISTIALPAILIGGGLLLNKAGQVSLALMTIAAVGWLVCGAMLGLYSPQPHGTGSLSDFVVVTVVLLMTAVSVQLLTSNLRRSLAHAQEALARRQQAEEALQRYAAQARQRADRLALLNNIGQAVSTLRDLPHVLETIHDQVQLCLPMDAFFVSLVDTEANQVFFPIMYDSGRRWAEPAEPIGAESYLSLIINSGQPILINRTAQEMAIPSEHQDMVGDKARKSASLMLAPLTVGERIIGVISVQSYTLHAYNQDDIGLLIGIGHQVAIAIENARLYSAVQQELAERLALVEKLEAQNAELERFTYTVSHDLKSPLVTIAGFVGFLEKDALAGNYERMQADLKHINDALGRMRRLLDDLLELSRIGRLINPPEEVPFTMIVQEALDLVHGAFEARGVQVALAADLPPVYCDRIRLVEVMQNLLDNAIKFMADQPRPCITIGMRSGASGPVFFVQDNGMGIEPRYHEKIFGLFEKLDKRSQGTGIGLALVRRIIEIHNGRIWVESTPGEGATFCFTLGLQQAVGEERIAHVHEQAD